MSRSQKRYWCRKYRKAVSWNKVMAECLMKNGGKSSCGNLIINIKTKKGRK